MTLKELGIGQKGIILSVGGSKTEQGETFCTSRIR